MTTPPALLDSLRTVLALFYPALCLACDEPLVSGEAHFCTGCRAGLPYLNHHQAGPAGAADTPLARRFWGKVPVRYAVAYLQFSPRGRVQQLLHRFKYDNQPEIGQVLGRWFGEELAQAGFGTEFDALVPVPMHPAKQRQRGYNQAACFAEGLAEIFGLPVREDVLIKVEQTDSQTRKSRVARWQNVAGGFAVPAEVAPTLPGQRLLLVDDVLTTGATLEACATALLAGGADTVSVATIAAAG
jgi:ComF family protein